MFARIALIAPHRELYWKAMAASGRLGSDVLILEGDLAEGVRAARRAIADGAEAIVSRGGTAGLIVENVDAPVVEIRVTPQDILRCLRRIRGAPGPIGIVGFANVIGGCESLGELLDLPLRLIEVTSQEDAQGKIVKAARQGIRTVIGDAVSVKQAVAQGLAAAFIHSGREAIVEAVDQARAAAAVRRNERERSELLRAVVETSRDGIMAISSDGRIILYNPAAGNIFSIPTAEALGRPVADVISNAELLRVLCEGTPEPDALQYVADKVIVTRRHAVNVDGRSVATIATFHDATELRRLEQIVRQKLHARRFAARTTLNDLVGRSPAMLRLKDRAAKYAVVKASVLIHGQTGTGKEMLAQGMHNLSQRANGPFVGVNCAALPENLLESELFGYEEGAFTGARKGGKPGLFELAHGGTIFLDEIGEMPLNLQARLLRVLQEQEILRVGGSRIIPIDVRVIAAANCHLPSRISNGGLRRDLYHRLAALRLNMPRLSERTGDIPLLVRHFLKVHRGLNPVVRGVEGEALACMASYVWPGNVRELEHAVQRLIILGETEMIGVETVLDLLRELAEDAGLRDPSPPVSGDARTVAATLAERERLTIDEALAQTGQNKTLAARLLGIDRSTLRRKLRR